MRHSFYKELIKKLYRELKASLVKKKFVVGIIISIGLHGMLLAALTVTNLTSSENTGESFRSNEQVIKLLLVESVQQPRHRPPISKIHATKPTQKNIKKISPAVVVRNSIKFPPQKLKADPKQKLVESMVIQTSSLQLEEIIKPVFSPSPIPKLPNHSREEIISRLAVNTSNIQSERAKKIYLTDLRTAINGQKYYPIRARRMRKQGDVWVEFFIYRDGRIEQVTIHKSSGEFMLDRAAKKSIQQLGSYQPFPNDIKDSFLSVLVPMKYALN